MGTNTCSETICKHRILFPSIQHLAWLPSATVVTAEPFLRRTGTLRCLPKEMATYRHWSVSLWWDPDDVSHCRILSPDKTEWRLHSADEDALSWQTSYGSWHAYEKKKNSPLDPWLSTLTELHIFMLSYVTYIVRVWACMVGTGIAVPTLRTRTPVKYKSVNQSLLGGKLENNYTILSVCLYIRLAVCIASVSLCIQPDLV